MLSNHPAVAPIFGRILFYSHKSYYASLSPQKITELLAQNQVSLNRDTLPSCIKSVECNQLASNKPIEDRLRVSSVSVPGASEPTLILGVFDGHGGGTTADLVSSRLFNYIALSLLPKSERLKISNHEQLKNIVFDLYNSPQPTAIPRTPLFDETRFLVNHIEQLDQDVDIAANLKASFRRCDDDLSQEIQQNLVNPKSDTSTLHYYLSAAVSGCCAIVMVIHQGFAYLASTGDCRAVLGVYSRDCEQTASGTNFISSQMFNAIELNHEHNCDNIDEIRRLASTHPKTEQNTMIKHNRLLGHLMPFRAFGDFNYKWPAELIESSGITRAFGSGVIPSNYNTPPYLIAEPDVNKMRIDVFSAELLAGCNLTCNKDNLEKCLVIASDGLWELFESSRDVIESLVDHSLNVDNIESEMDYDSNCATHIIRSALRSGSYQDFGKDADELRRLYHVRLESILTLPQAVVRNFRDDISIIVLKM